jgi:hypothetical protein
MKELRFEWQRQVWRVAFAFDPQRQAILLAGGDKGGADQKRFYGRLIATADSRFERYLAALKPPKSGKKAKERFTWQEILINYSEACRRSGAPRSNDAQVSWRHSETCVRLYNERKRTWQRV